MGFCSEDEALRFLRLAPLVEQAMVDSGIILLKYWLEVGQEEQTRRIESRIDDPRKVWKLSPMDLKSYSRWYDYSQARDEMFAATNTEFAPWHVADSNDKKRARLNVISHLLEQLPYDSPRRKPVRLPAREKRAATASPTTPTSTSQPSTESYRRRRPMPVRNFWQALQPLQHRWSPRTNPRTLELSIRRAALRLRPDAREYECRSQAASRHVPARRQLRTRARARCLQDRS